MTRKQNNSWPRLPLEGAIDLTYRCNLNCRHCWLWLPEQALEKHEELTLDEVRRLADEARALGCQGWTISGGEPMLRPDFPEIFDYLTAKAVSYTLNTNGTLITPVIANLMRRRGSKLIALYGATREINDHITRTPGSFEALMKGMAYLREAGAGFTVQIIPMKDNFHQYQQMIRLALTLSPSYRLGAAWLYLSAKGDKNKNREILNQRLSPAQAVRLDPPDPCAEEMLLEKNQDCQDFLLADDRFFAACIHSRREFHVDPYGGISFCGYIKKPDLRFDWRRGNFIQAWETFIPALAGECQGGEEFRKNCGSCPLIKDCRWCAVYGFLEHRRFSAPVRYLCQIAKETARQKKLWPENHRRFYKIGGITVQLDSDLPITSTTFASKFSFFSAAGPGEDTIRIRHHFSIPRLQTSSLGKEVYHKPPWVIYRHERGWIYAGISPHVSDRHVHLLATISDNYARITVYHDREKLFRQGGSDSLALFPTDQIWLAPILAERQGFFLHAAGMKISGQGLLFAGHSKAGKSTTVTLLQDEGEILCDDRMIVRRWPDGFRIHGTWSHGDVPNVSAAEAPLRAILFLEKSKSNRLIPIEDPREVLKRILPLLVKPLVTAAWWEKTLAVVEKFVREAPAYRLQFDKSGKIKETLDELFRLS